MKKTIIVTGASRGLGAHICQRATEAGYHVIGVARQAVTDRDYEIRACDIADPGQVKALGKNLRIESALYGLVNVAGIASMNLMVSTPPETLQRIVATNLLGMMYCCAAFAKVMARAGRPGRVVNFSSIAVKLGLKGEAAYLASKAGVEGFTLSFAREMADFNITVNAIAPGPIDTDLIKSVPSDKVRAIIDRQVIPRQGEPEDIWRILAYLLDESSDMVSGEVIRVGGM